MIIHSSRKNTFFVKKVQTKDILDFQSWWPEFTNKMQFLLKAPMAKKGQRKTLVSSYHEFILEVTKRTVAASKFIKGTEHGTYSFKIPGTKVQLPTR